MILLQTLAGASPAIADQLANLNLGDPDAVRKPLCKHCARRFNAVAGIPTPVVELYHGARFDLIDMAAYTARVKAAAP